jgi:hypothetical protein
VLGEPARNRVVCRPPPGLRELGDQSWIRGGQRGVRAGGLEPGQHPAGDEVPEGRSEQRDVHGTAADQNPAVRGLGEALAPSSHREDNHGAVTDTQPEDLITAGISGLGDGPVHPGQHLAVDVEPAGASVRGDAQEDDSGIGVGEGHHGLLDLVLRQALFELQMPVLSREGGDELRSRHRRRRLARGIRVERRVCHSCWTRSEHPISMA